MITFERTEIHEALPCEVGKGAGTDADELELIFCSNENGQPQPVVLFTLSG